MTLPADVRAALGNEKTAARVLALSEAVAANVHVLAPPFASEGVRYAFVQFPCGYVAEIHASAAFSVGGL